MGNLESSVSGGGVGDASILSEVHIDESPILSSPGCWTLHHAQVHEDDEDDGGGGGGGGGGADGDAADASGEEDLNQKGGRNRRSREQFSVFVSKASKKSGSATLEPLGKNLKVYRHPKILRFVSSCIAGGREFLFTEKASPLSAVIAGQGPLQICLGLHDLAEALHFLHERGRASHNNVSVGCVFVTPDDGRWKLGGMEFVKRFEEESQSFFDQSRPLRCSDSVPPEEKKATTPGSSKGHHLTARDVYGFGRLALEALAKGRDANGDEEIPETSSFLDFARSRLCNPDPSLRPASLLEDVLGAHPYFVRREYLRIQRFLADLPLKTENEKEDFFSTLLPRLFSLPPETLSLQLASPLLSRYVLLDPTARKLLLPSLFTPAKFPREDFCPEREVNPLVPEHLFIEHCTPIVLKVMHVRELQIRSVLLEHFSSYFRVIPRSSLEDVVLPQLLLGVRDTNDGLVSSTLRSLSDLVSILGAAVVVGGARRRKIFADGAPAPMRPDLSRTKLKTKSKAKEDKEILQEKRPSPVVPFPSERRSPIGAEKEEVEVKTANRLPQEGEEVGDDDPGWEDWGEEDNQEVEEEQVVQKQMTPDKSMVDQLRRSAAAAVTDLDIHSLDIKVSKAHRASSSSPDDFFADMEPKIESRREKQEEEVEEADEKVAGDATEDPTTADASSSSAKPLAGGVSKFAVADDGGGGGGDGSEGWGDWGEEEEEEEKDFWF